MTKEESRSHSFYKLNLRACDVYSFNKRVFLQRIDFDHIDGGRSCGVCSRIVALSRFGCSCRRRHAQFR
jgi:hypothetical protein